MQVVKIASFIGSGLFMTLALFSLVSLIIFSGLSNLLLLLPQITITIPNVMFFASTDIVILNIAFPFYSILMDRASFLINTISMTLNSTILLIILTFLTFAWIYATKTQTK